MAFNNGSAPNGAITQEQRTAARVAGPMYPLLGALAAFAEFYVRSGILVYGDAAQTAHNIVASERLFRIGIATDLLGGACNATRAAHCRTRRPPL